MAEDLIVVMTAKFQRTFLEGEYGGGEVYIWDSGIWGPDFVDPSSDLDKGHLKFNLKGKKPKGNFVLVPTRYKDESGKSSPLFKNHDEAEIPDYELRAISQSKKAST